MQNASNLTATVTIHVKVTDDKGNIVFEQTHENVHSGDELLSIGKTMPEFKEVFK